MCYRNYILRENLKAEIGKVRIQFCLQILLIWNAKHRQNPVTGHTCVNSNENHDTLKSVSLKSLTVGCRRRLSVMHVRKQEEKS